MLKKLAAIGLGAALIFAPVATMAQTTDTTAPAATPSPAASPAKAAPKAKHVVKKPVVKKTTVKKTTPKKATPTPTPSATPQS
jgi:hypothetical protein